MISTSTDGAASRPTTIQVKVLARQIMEDVTDLVLEFNGSLSGEHGVGLVRSEWNRKMFGPVVYEAFRQVKRGFDPGNVLNPGKVVPTLHRCAEFGAMHVRGGRLPHPELERF